MMPGAMVIKNFYFTDTFVGRDRYERSTSNGDYLSNPR
jgi:hypothetical protein